VGSIPTPGTKPAGFFKFASHLRRRAALPDDLRGVVTFAYLTGWRINSEVLPLNWSQVNRTARTVRLEPGTTKNSEGRMLPYGDHPELVELIDAQWQAHELSFRKAWNKACKAAGYPGKIPHDFRRTAVRNLERAGVSRSAAMKITGHKTENVYRRYAIVSEGDLREGLGKLAGGTGQVWGKWRRTGRIADEENVCLGFFIRKGAGGGNRTHTGLLDPQDFKSCASANFATPASSPNKRATRAAGCESSARRAR